MIRVTILNDSKGAYEGIRLKGHAGYDVHGQDIVCASVSALVFNMANSVEAFTEDEFKGEANDSEGEFTFLFTSGISLESKLLMDSLILGLENIKKEYGKQYIKILFEEV